MTAIAGVEPAHAPNGAYGREQKNRAALDAGADTQRSPRSRERMRDDDEIDQSVHPGMLINIEV